MDFLLDAGGMPDAVILAHPAVAPLNESFMEGSGIGV